VTVRGEVQLSEGEPNGLHLIPLIQLDDLVTLVVGGTALLHHIRDVSLVVGKTVARHVGDGLVPQPAHFSRLRRCGPLDVGTPVEGDIDDVPTAVDVGELLIPPDALDRLTPGRPVVPDAELNPLVSVVAVMAGIPA